MGLHCLDGFILPQLGLQLSQSGIICTSVSVTSQVGLLRPKYVCNSFLKKIGLYCLKIGYVPSQMSPYCLSWVCTVKCPGGLYYPTWVFEKVGLYCIRLVCTVSNGLLSCSGLLDFVQRLRGWKNLIHFSMYCICRHIKRFCGVRVLW